MHSNLKGVLHPFSRIFGAKRRLKESCNKHVFPITYFENTFLVSNTAKPLPLLIVQKIV